MTRPAISRERLDRLTIPPEATLIEALRVIEDGARGVAFVCDRRRRVVGTVTDGDIRRALLSGAALDSRCLPTIMNRAFSKVSPAAGRAEVLDMMRARGIEQVPIIDTRGQLRGVHSLHNLIGAGGKDNWAVIMAGGKGVRLGPLTENVPKPMIVVAGRPILERMVLHLVGSGITRIFLAVNHLAHVIESHFGDGSKFGCQIEYLRESKPLGTGGALSLLPSPATRPVIVVNGDLVTQFDVGRMLTFHGRGGYAVTFGLQTHSIEVPFGVAKVRGQQLIGLREKPTETMLINAGIYVLDPRAIRLIPTDRQFHIIELLDRCMRKRMKVGAHVIEDEWIDVGRHEELSKARGQR